MKICLPGAALLAAAMLAVVPQAGALPANTWNAAGGGNWSTPGNWSLGHVPAANEDLVFGATGTGVANIDDINFQTNNTLTYNQANSAQQLTTISAGNLLTINSTNAAGQAIFSVGTGANNPIPVQALISGGGTLNVNGLGNIVVRQGNSANGSQIATLDMSGLDTFNATAGRLLVGQAGGSPDINRPSGTLILARTNNITLSGGSPQVVLQDATVNANGSVVCLLRLGQYNVINGDTWRLAGQKGNGTIDFNPSFSNPSLKIRNADGVSPSTVIDFGYNSAVSTGNGTVCVADFSAGTVDIYANLVHVTQGGLGSGTGTCISTVTLGAGTFAAGTFELGYANATTTSGVTTGTLNLNNNGAFASGATLTVNTTLRLARTNSPLGGTCTGTLNVNGGSVFANTIVAGGGVSVINLNSFSPASKLVVTNTAGTLVSPISTFSMSDAILTVPALNGGASVAVKTLAVGGSANTINVSAIPPVGSYPADFTLISYQTGYTPGAGPISLGSLPAASPAYAGTLVDVGGGVIQLHLTSGPVANLGMHWTGANSSDWDLSQYNWTFLGYATNFFNGSSPLFDDATTQTNVNIATAVSPGAIIVSNITGAYTFSGPANISGAGSLTKKGASSLTIVNQGVDNIGTVVVTAGTLQIGNGGTDGALSALNITNNGALVFNRSGVLNLSAPIAGTGALSQTGNGTLVLSGASSYSGATTVSAGTLQMDGSVSGGGPVSVASGAVLAGGGSFGGAVTVSGQVNPGSQGVPGTLTVNNNLTLNSGGTLVYDLNAANAGNPAFNDSITVNGNLNVNNNVITVNFDGAPQGGTYTLFTYTGSLNGLFNPIVLGTHFTVTLDTNTPGVVNLNVVGGSGANLEWASPSDSTWNVIVTNWFDLDTLLPSTFSAGDNVILDDTNSVQTTLTIPSGVNVAPGTITDNATNNYYTINGPGHIVGSTGIVKSGPSTLTLSTANSFTGTVDVQGGTLQLGSGTALGATASGTTVQDGATLDVNGQNVGGESITIIGAGTGSGALVNNGGGQAQVLRTLVLGGDATIGGSALLGMNNSGGSASLSTGGNTYSLTKVGGNQFTIQNAAVDSNLGNIIIQQGIVEFNSLTATMGNPDYTNFVAAGGEVSFANNTVAWRKFFDLTGDGSSTTVNNGGGANTELDGVVALHGNVVFNVGGTAMVLTNEIGGDGGLTKNGGSPLLLFGPTTFTGDTIINGTSAIRLNGAADLAFSTNVTINAGAFLTVTGMVNSTFILYADHNLMGNGGLNGKLTANAGSTISPGVNAIGALLVSNQIVLLGTNIMELDQDNGTNDVLRSGLSTITYGGTLSLVNVGSPLTNGASFKLYNATSYIGSFATITPATPGPGQVWDLSALNTSGTIKVGSASAPGFANTVSIVGGNMIFHGTNGMAGQQYVVLASTNAALPLSSWTPIATNTFDGSGNYSVTNAVNPASHQQFFIIVIP